jgi:hypothetical protein
MTASEFDQLIAQDGILMAGRFGPDWTAAALRAAASVNTVMDQVPQVFDALAP